MFVLFLYSLFIFAAGVVLGLEMRASYERNMRRVK